MNPLMDSVILGNDVEEFGNLDMKFFIIFRKILDLRIRNIVLFLNKIFMGEISSHVNFVLILSSGNNTIVILLTSNNFRTSIQHKIIIKH